MATALSNQLPCVRRHKYVPKLRKMFETLLSILYLSIECFRRHSHWNSLYRNIWSQIFTHICFVSNMYMNRRKYLVVNHRICSNCFSLGMFTWYSFLITPSQVKFPFESCMNVLRMKQSVITAEILKMDYSSALSLLPCDRDTGGYIYICICMHIYV